MPFGPVKQINAGLLNVGYVEVGLATARAVVLLHGWPYDIHSYADVAPILAARGYRVLVPYLRGYGSTRFLASETFRNGQPSATAVDLIDLMDTLKIDKAIIAGFDWGARTADIVAALWPQRCKALVSVSGYLIGSQESSKIPLPPNAEFQWWYQFYFATERGRAGYDKYRRDFAKLIWQQASPKWHFDDATFDRSAAAFENADHVSIVIHNYRWRLALADGEPRYADLEKRLASARSSPFRPSHWKAMPMGHHTPSQAPTPRNSLANMSTGTSPAALGTTCLKRHRMRSPRPWSTLITSKESVSVQAARQGAGRRARDHAAGAPRGPEAYCESMSLGGRRVRARFERLEHRSRPRHDRCGPHTIRLDPASAGGRDGNQW